MTQPFPHTAVGINEIIRTHLGEQLRTVYGNPAEIRLPRHLARLAGRVAQVIRAYTEPVDQIFIDAVLRALPSLRGFAITLTKNIDRAEDLVQDTVVKAIGNQDRFAPGTNIEAWLFTILRNGFYSAHRKRWREVEDEDGLHTASLVMAADQEGRIVMRDLQAALAKLSPKHREALILVGMEGLAYGEAAAVLGVKLGTMKSRVNRARARLAELMEISIDPTG